MIAATSTVVAPSLLLAAPFALFAILLPPRRLIVQIAGVMVLAGLLVGEKSSAAPYTTMYWFEHAWPILLGVWFVAAVLLMRRAGFVSRAIAALAGSTATAAMWMAANRGSFDKVDSAVWERLKVASTAIVTAMGEVMKSRPAADAALVSQRMMKTAELQAFLFPAMLGIASIASLGAAWWIFRKLAARDAQPLRPLREFRFSDHLVWVFVIGALLMILPWGAVAHRTGSNLVMFMVALYALRGLAIFTMIGAGTGPMGILIGLVLFVVLNPLVIATTIVVGLTDTWLDIRSRRQTPQRPGT